MMKLYNLSSSPYAARVRIQIYHKNLPVEIMDPPIALRTKEFLDAFPLGKLPLLEIENGNTIAESTVIMDYLEALHPTPALTPASPIEQAHNGMLIRYTDNHLAQGLSPLFVDFFSQISDKEIISPKLATLRDEMKKLENLFGYLPDFNQRALQTSDICLATNMFYVIELTEWFAEKQFIESFPSTCSWWQWVNKNQAVVTALGEMAEGYKVLVARLTGDSA